MEGVGLPTRWARRSEGRDWRVWTGLGDPADHPAPLALGGSTPDAISLTSLDCIVQAFLPYRASGTDGEADRRIVVGPGEEHRRVLSPALRASRPRPILIWIHERGHLILHTVCMTYRREIWFPLWEELAANSSRSPVTGQRSTAQKPPTNWVLEVWGFAGPGAGGASRRLPRSPAILVRRAVGGGRSALGVSPPVSRILYGLPRDDHLSGAAVASDLVRST